MESADFGAIAARHGVRLLLRFGSTVTGRTHAQSDVDIAVLFEGEPSFDREAELLVELASAFPGQEVDLGVLNHADPLFLAQVVEHAQLLAGAPRQLAELRLLAFRRYQDHKPYLEMETEYLDRFVSARARS